MTVPKVSVVMPVYQVEEYIEESVRSVCRQTLRDFELILINDGTEDASIENALQVLVGFGDLNWRVINQENRGVSAARNAGITAAIGEYVICIDPDDTIAPELLEVLYNGCVSTNANAAFCHCNFVNRKTMMTFKEFSGYNLLKMDEIVRRYLIHKIVIVAPAVMIRRELLIDKALYFCEECRFSEDIHFIWRLLFICETICLVPDRLYNYLSRPDSIMTSSCFEKILTGWKTYLSLPQELLAIAPSYEKWIKLILPRWILGVLHASANLLDYPTFHKLALSMNYRHNVKKLFTFPDIRIKILAGLVFLNLRLFYLLFRKMHVR